MRRFILWLAMVVVMIALLLGAAALFLYSRTGEDSCLLYTSDAADE